VNEPSPSCRAPPAPSSLATASLNLDLRRCHYPRPSSSYYRRKLRSRPSISLSAVPIRAATTTASATWPWLSIPTLCCFFIYAGNDFVAPDQGYSIWPRLLDESPGGSIVGSIMPRTNWLLVNRLNLSEFLGSQSKAPPNAEEILYAAITAPPDERLKRLVAYVKTNHFPEVPEGRIAEILSRGNSRLLDIALPHEGEQEYLLDWMFQSLMSWETWNFKVPTSRQDAPQFAGDGKVEATLSWIEATGRLLRSRGIPLLIVLAPVGSVDPEYVEFWKPWPRPFGWNYICEEMHARLATALAKDGLRYVDLREDLDNIQGTYRKLDGHWSQKGEAIVAHRVARELNALLSTSSDRVQTGADGSDR
jgi:acetyltransferase AlgX (SGNH hydrolase-like protein)